MHATGARINVNKSRPIALGSWNKSTPIMDIKHHDDITLQGFHMTMTIQESATKSWALITAKIRAQVQEAYHRALNLEHKIRYVNGFLTARLWLTTQIPPYRLRPTDEHGHIMVPIERRNLQTLVIHVTKAKRVLGQSSDIYLLHGAESFLRS